ncbi:MAG: transketolase [Coriobacteriia bacterium]|nr:transketolase [Coriobacteriia bacterium]
MVGDGFDAPLSAEDERELARRAHEARAAVLTATTAAGSGHPGGSFSSMELLTVLYGCARLRPEDPGWPDRDRVVVSHGHVSPGTYSALAQAGFFATEDLEAHFRQAGSPFEGHVERSVPGVEWSTGNLGQGLSAGVGFALAARLTRRSYRTFVTMSDGEQHKGQGAEARRLAAGSSLGDLTVVVDLNGIQITGHTEDIMPVNVRANFEADGWGVIECDGQRVGELHEAIRAALADRDRPVAVLAHTVAGHPVSVMLDDPAFHGKALTEDEYAVAMRELGFEPRLEAARARRTEAVRTSPREVPARAMPVVLGEPRTYGADVRTDNRSAWGAALSDLEAANPGLPMAVLDCDLAESVKTGAFWEARPDAFIECGVGEHNAAVVAGALSVSDVLAFWADFGVFGLDEAYNMQRLNDINHASVKLVLTHCGLDVGEDGKTHQCLDYVGALRDFFGWRLIVPADPNQTDRAVRASAAMAGNVCVAMGRSKLPVVLAEDGTPAFGEGYEFRYGRIDWVRRGTDGCIVTMGTVAGSAVAAADGLAAEGSRLSVGVAASPLHLDDADMTEAAACGGCLITAEDHGVRTGLGASVAEWLSERAPGPRLVRLGVDSYRSSGAATDLLADAGLDAEGIAASVRRVLGG